MPRRDKWTTPRIPVSIERDGVTYRGHYQGENGMIRVEYEWASKTTKPEGFRVKSGRASKTTQLGGLSGDPLGLARVMLAELVQENPEKG